MWMLHDAATTTATTTTTISSAESSNSKMAPASDRLKGQQRQQQSVRLGSDQASDHRRLRRTYSEWREFAVDLARKPPAEILQILNDDDPFGVRTFESDLAQWKKQREEVDSPAQNGGKDGGQDTVIDTIRSGRLFLCNPLDRISLPDQRNATKAQMFREGEDNGYFLYFQHLRKAGGTNFCTLATQNFPEEHLPPYYCMPDYDWDKDNYEPCAGCLHHWTNDEIVRNMKQHRIAGNEWESFDVQHHFDLPAVFVTSFRKPVHRALSQFRFECTEHRGCHIQNEQEWWRRRTDLHNVYTWTFSDTPRQHSFARQDTAEAAAMRANAVGVALDTISKFHLVLVMEWLELAKDAVTTVLGFPDTSALTQRVRPHNQQKQRQDSWNAEEHLDPSVYKEFAENLALDEILTDAARRFFLERLVCNDH
jgi:hypothetical protein